MVTLGEDFSVRELDEPQEDAAEFEIGTTTRSGRRVAMKVSLFWESERGGYDNIKQSFRLEASDMDDEVCCLALARQ